MSRFDDWASAEEREDGFMLLDDAPTSAPMVRLCLWPTFDDGTPCEQLRPCPHHDAVTGLPKDGRVRCLSNAGCSRLAVRGADLCEEHGGEPDICGKPTKGGGSCHWIVADGPCRWHK